MTPFVTVQTVLAFFGAGTVTAAQQMLCCGCRRHVKGLDTVEEACEGGSTWWRWRRRRRLSGPTWSPISFTERALALAGESGDSTGGFDRSVDEKLDFMLW